MIENIDKPLQQPHLPDIPGTSSRHIVRRIHIVHTHIYHDRYTPAVNTIVLVVRSITSRRELIENIFRKKKMSIILI